MKLDGESLCSDKSGLGVLALVTALCTLLECVCVHGAEPFVKSGSTYVFWSRHEPEPGRFDWSGENDLAEFCRLAQAEGLQVLLRPGPYVCGEFDLGGMPWWLLKDRNMRLRSSYPGFLNPVRGYFKALGEQLAPLQATRGGPIVMVQVENEGSHGPWGDELRIDRRGELPAVSYGAEELRLRRTDR